jgi:hypothetical protein
MPPKLLKISPTDTEDKKIKIKVINRPRLMSPNTKQSYYQNKRREYNRRYYLKARSSSKQEHFDRHMAPKSNNAKKEVEKCSKIPVKKGMTEKQRRKVYNDRYRCKIRAAVAHFNKAT